MIPKLPAACLSAITIVLVVAFAACGSDQDGRPPGNLTDAEWQRFKEFADDAESGGYLRPFLPAYLPDGFDRTAHLFDDDARIRTIVLFGPLDSLAEDNPRPGELQVIRWGPDPSLEPTPYAPCEELADGEECVDVQGVAARLGDSSLLDPESITYHLEFPKGDSVVLVSGNWGVDEGTRDQFRETLRDEVLKVAESVVEP